MSARTERVHGGARDHSAGGERVGRHIEVTLRRIDVRDAERAGALGAVGACGWLCEKS